jgi:LysM repeat protein
MRNPVRLLVVLVTAHAFLVSGLAGVSAQSTSGQYVVQPGDNLGFIAQQFGVDVNCLVNINRIPNPNRIAAGQSLEIRACQQPVGTINSPINAPVPTTYTVQAGDRLGDIARRYGLDANCLARTNSLVRADIIYAGQILHLGPCQSPGSTGVVASVYTVQVGDRLTDIASRFGVNASCLARVNALTDPGRIQPGRLLQIDPCILQGGGIAPLPAAQNYTVQRGDRLGNIASIFGVDLICLARSNAIGNPDNIWPGETLVVNYARCRTGASG